MTAFSRRTPASFDANPWSRARAALGDDAIDWTVSNPESAHLFDETMRRRASEILGTVRDGPYRPDACGRLESREAVATLYETRGVSVDPDDVVLTASTSDAYGLLFRVLCDPGDPVAMPLPSYPLLEHLARLEGVRGVSFPLDAGAGWRPDPLLPAECVGVRVLVHPNNPTGTHADGPAINASRERALRDRETWIVDEVFLDYPHGSPAPSDSETTHASYAAEHEIPCVALGGLSKRFGLPGAKLSWIVLAGPPDFRRELRTRLAFAADQYLNVGYAVQRALPDLIAEADVRHERIHARVLDNAVRIRRWADERPQVDRLPTEGGWTACLRLPRIHDDEARSLDLMRRHAVVVQPGYLFDFPDAGWLVVSLLASPEVTGRGLEALDAELASDS